MFFCFLVDEEVEVEEYEGSNADEPGLGQDGSEQEEDGEGIKTESVDGQASRKPKVEKDVSSIK